MNPFFSQIRRPVILVFLALGLLLSLTGVLDSWINDRILGELAASNTAYLDDAFDRSSQLFLVLTGIKSVLAVVEGSHLGVGFGLQVGDIVQGVYDYVDFAWKIVLLSTVVIVMTRMLLEVALYMDQILLTLTILALLIHMPLRWLCPQWRTLNRFLRDLTFFLALFSLSAYLILPFAVAGGAVLSGEITRARLQDSTGEIVALKAELQVHYQEIEEAQGLFRKVDRLQSAMGGIIDLLQAQARSLFWNIVGISAAYLFDAIIFPLGLFALFFWIARLLGRYLFGIRNTQAFKEDLSAMMDRYWSRKEKDPSDGPTV